MLQEAGATPAPSVPIAPLGLDALIEDRRARLVAYQDAAYAQRFTDFMARVMQAERALGEAARDMPLSTAVARSLYKLMAYKDEYEVARLYSDPAFMKRLGAQFEGTPRLAFTGNAVKRPSTLSKARSLAASLRMSLAGRSPVAVRTLRELPFSATCWLVMR